MSKANINSLEQSQPANYLVWVEYTKAFGLILIILNHFTEVVMCCAYFGYPSGSWPPLEQRIAQLLPIQHEGISSIFLNLWRYIGWSGNAGVQLFLIISGFGLTWGLLHRQGTKTIALGWFYRRRLLRIYPLWWAMHFVILGMRYFNLKGIESPALFLLSFLGIRLTPRLFYYLVPAWWYIGLLIQLYLIFPLLWKALQRWRIQKAFLIVMLIAFLIRGIGLFILEQYFPDYISVWSYGGIFITRLPEFFFGMSFAWYLYHNSTQVEKLAQHRSMIFVGVLIYLFGMVLSVTFWGMTFALFLLGLGLFIPIYVIYRHTPKSENFDLGVWIGKHSYSIFLTHHLIIQYLVPPTLNNVPLVFLRFAIAIVATVISSLLLERTVDWIMALFSQWYKQYGITGVGLRLLRIGILFFILLVALEHLVRQVAPQNNVFGWVAPLEPDPNFGWKLIPSKTTHLRWESYDYMQTSNSLGFPGPEYSETKPANTFRIMVVGDAFSSAEGVDTNDGWPRLLEAQLRKELSMEVEVLDFAITGYGPKQYAAVMKAYAPIYKPDLVIVQMFVNDYDDVMRSDDDFRSRIFSSVTEDSIRGFFEPRHLNAFIFGDVLPTLLNEDRPNSYFWGYFQALEFDQPNYEEKKRLVKTRLQEIQSIVNQINSELMVILVPASSQVCSASDLPYYPKHVDINNTDKYDVNLPQNTTRDILSSLGLELYDLRDPLKAVSNCPYQPYNLHWLKTGHKAVADYVAQVIENHYIEVDD